MEKCKNCQSKCSGCMWIEANHPRGCDFANPDHPDYDPGFIGLHDEWCQGKPDEPRRDSAQPRKDLSIERAVVECGYRQKPSCGCPEEAHTCTHPEKAGEKWFLDCYLCKQQELRPS